MRTGAKFGFMGNYDAKPRQKSVNKPRAEHEIIPSGQCRRAVTIERDTQQVRESSPPNHLTICDGAGKAVEGTLGGNVMLQGTMATMIILRGEPMGCS